MSVTTENRDGILIVTIDNPPVNALGGAVRQGIQAALDAAKADGAVKALVLYGVGRLFSAGADITEFTKAMVEPALPTLLDSVEAFDKPIVAAVRGNALGGGCETALASHYRIAAPSAKFGLPEVKLGILPGAGGSQRLPRVVGVVTALEIMTKGDPLPAAKAKEAGLVDRLATEDNLLDEAVAFAREIADARPLPRASERQVKADAQVFADFRKANARRFRGYDAPEEIIALIEKTITLPYAEGSQLEKQSFMKLILGQQSAALRHIFFAERKTAKIDDISADTAPRPTNKIGVIGAGTMGGGIAMNFLSAGLPVTLIETAQEALDRGVGIIRKNYEATAARGRLTSAQVEQAMALITPSLDFAALADCDLIIEAVYEDIEVKKQVFAKLDGVAKPGAILATNTSFLNIDEIAAATKRPEDVLGLHFFSPANVMKLLEVVRAAKTAPDVLVTAMTVAKKIRKTAVIARVCFGFIGNRMVLARQIEADKLLLEGASPEQIDKVHNDFGMAMGPYQMLDLAGVDIGWHRDPSRIENLRDALAAEGRWGQKKGAGWYDYDDKRNPSPSPRVAEILAAFRASTGTPQHVVTTEEIVERTLYPMINEGAKILAEGVAQRASDIDIVWIFGYGWPPYRGGPMYWANNLEGLGKIVAGLEKHGFEVAPLLREKAEKGEKFA